MFSPSTVSILLQVIAAVAICFIGYLALLTCAIVGLILAKFIYISGRFVWCRVISRKVSANILTAKVGGHTHIAPSV